MALFATDGAGQTNIDVAGLSYIKYITFDTALAGPYTLGTGAANSQTLVLADSGEIKLSPTAVNSQVFNCGVQLGTDRSGQLYYLRNDNPSQSLIFNDLFFVGQGIGGSTGNKTLAVSGSGPVSILGSIRQNGATAVYFHHNSSSTVTLGGSNVFYNLNMYGGPSSVLDIGSQELVLNNVGGNVLNCYLGGTITGAGKLRLSTWDGISSAGYNYADLNVTGGKTLVINCEITGAGGFESNNGNGTFVLNGTNTFLGHMNLATAGGTVSVTTIGNRGVASNCGMGTNLYFANASRLLYTGTGESTDRVIVMNNNPTVEQAGPGGTLRFTATPILTGGRTMTLQGSTLGVGEFSAPLSNTGGNTLTIIKNGSGTWRFSGTNTYTGSTTVNGGKLLLGGAGSLAAGSAVTVNSGATLAGSGKASGSVTVASGGTVAPGDINTVGTLTLGGTLNMTSAALCYDLVSADAVGVETDKLAVASALTLNGTNTVVLSFPNGVAPAGTYTLMTFASKTGSGIFQLAAPYANATLSTDSTSLKLEVVGSSYATTWAGAESASWDTGLNWTNGSEAVAYTPGEAVVFDDTAAQFSVSSAAPVAPATTVFNNSASDYSISAVIDGTGTVYKLGSGTVSLTGNNVYTGQTAILGGTLRIDGAGQLGGGLYAASLLNNGEFVYASSAAQTHSGVISGGGNLTQFGSGLLTLSGNNTFVGVTTVTSGVLRAQHANALGSTAQGTVVATNGVLELAGGIVTASEAISLFGTLSSASGSNTVSGIVSAQHGSILHAAANATLVINSVVPNIGSNTFTKTGPGLLRFTADPNPTGMFVIDEGTVELQHSGSTDINFTINPNGTLRQFTLNDLGDNYTMQANGTLDFRANDTIGGLSGSGIVTNSGSSAVAITVCNNNQSGVFSGVIRNGAGAATMAVTKTGSGFLTLSGANTFSGGFNFSAGQLNIDNGGTTTGESALGTGTFTLGGGLIDNTSGADVTLLPTIAKNWNSDFTFIGSKSLNFGPGNVTLNANRTVTVATNTLTVGGAIGGNYALTKNGAGTLVLNGANTYNGATTVNGGSFIVNGSTAAGSVTVNSGLLGGSGTINGAANLVIGSLLSPGGLGTVGTLTFANAAMTNLTLNGNTLLFDLSSAADVCDKVKLSAGTAKLALNGTNTIALAFPAGGAPAGDYTLMTCPGGVITNAGAALKLLTAYPNATLAMVATNLVLTLSDAATPGVAWTGAASGTWDGGNLNWTADGSTSIAYPAGASVTFGDAAGTFGVFSDAAVSPATVLFNNSLNAYEVSAQISGTAPFAKVGAAPVTLTGTSDYNPASIFVGDGPLLFSGASQLNSGNYAGTLVNNSTLVFSNANPQVLGGTLSGGGTLTKYGNATLTLAGSNFFSGVTTVNQGVLKVTHPYGLGSTINGTVVNPGATLEVAGNISTLGEAVTLNGLLSNQVGSNTLGGVVTVYTGSSIDVGAGSVLVLNNNIVANGPFTKTGAGWLKLAKDPNGNGVMTVQNGVVEFTAGTMDASAIVNSGATLVATTANAFNDSSTRLQLDAGSTYILRQWDQVGGLAGAGTITQDLAAPAWLVIGANGFSETFSGSMQNGAGVLGLTKVGVGIQTLTGANTYTGATVVGQGTLFVNSPGSLAGTAVTVSNSATFGGSASVGGPVTLLPGGSLVAGAPDAIGTLALGSSLALNGNALFFDLPASGTVCDTVAVAGSLALEGVNTVVLSFPGGVAAEGDYTLMTFATRSGSGSFAPLASYPNTTLELTDASLVLHVGSGGLSGLTWSGSLSSQWDGGVLNWKQSGADASFATGGAVLFDDSASQYTVSSVGNVAPSAITLNNSINPYYIGAPVTGTAPLTKSGTAFAVLTGTTAFNPSFITISAGSLVLGNAARLNSGTYAGPVTVNGNLTHFSSASQTLSGPISGAGSLSKTGSATLTLSGTNAYLGGTTMSGGTLVGRGSPTVLGFGALAVSAGTTDLQNDTDMGFTNSVNLNGSATFKTGRVSQGGGVTHALGPLVNSSGADYTLTLSVGASVDNNTPYGLTFGALNLNGRSPTFAVNNNGAGLATLTLGSVSGNNNMTKTGNGTLFLPVPGNSNRTSASTTLNGGTLKLGAPGSLGTSGATLSLTAGTLDLAIDSSVFAHNTTVGGNVTCKCDRASANAAGITHTLGTLNMGAYTLSVTNGPNVLANSPYGLTFGTATLTGNATFDVADAGTLSLGAISGNFTVTKRNHGTLKLAGVNTSTAATTVNQGKLMGVTGGSSASSAITLQSALSVNAAAKLGVLCATLNGQWTCGSLTLAVPAAPATTNPALEFAFSVLPSGTVAPLRVTGAATFTAAPSGVAVYLGSLSVTNGVYPLLTVGSASAYPVPTLTVFGGYAGSTLAWNGNTLYLTLNGSPSPILWATGAAGSGVWDVNNEGNPVWKDNTGVAASYQEQPAGVMGNSVIFDDANITADTLVTLNSIVSPTSVAFSNTTYSYTVAGAGGIAGNIGLVKAGSNTVTLATANSYTGGTVVAGGTLTLTSGGVLSHTAGNLLVGNALLTNALLKIESGAVASNKWLMAGSTNGAAGAIYNQGSLVLSGGANFANFALGFGVGGYGYYRHDTPAPLTVAETGIASQNNGNGVFDVLQGAVTNGSYFLVNRGNTLQYGQVNIMGGRLLMPNSNAQAALFWVDGSSGQGVLNVSGGGLLGSLGTSTELDLIKTATSASAIGVLNILSAGTVQATKVKASKSQGVALVNFNGGTLKVNNGGYLMLGGSNIDRATVYAGGATIDTDGKNTAVSQALLAPTGNGVTFIEVTVPGSGYIGRPMVSITSGGGTGATGVADFDPASGVVSGVTITSPGYGYSSAPSVAFIGGGGVAPTVGTVTIAPVASGGLTKSGNGTLTLSGANTYSGATVISNGVLKLGAANALWTNSPVVVAGGTLDLNGHTLTNPSINLISGSIVNGTLIAPVLQGADSGVIQAQIVSTNGLEKKGSGTLIVGAPLTYPGDTVISGGTMKLSGRKPGLYEGRVSGSFELNAANPKTATPLSARYAGIWYYVNGESGGAWGDNTTYVYTGYLWNSSPTNETWSFYKYFDDNTRIRINGVSVLQNATSSAVVISNAVVNAGANAFEVRLGQGSGSVGPNGNAALGLGFDRLGRGVLPAANFVPFVDPGDGSLLTLTNEFDLANANVLPTNSAVTIAAGALLDLGETGQRLAGLSGSGTVSNGTLTVNGVIAPGGVGAIGTLTLATSSATLGGTLRVDASYDGACDVLAVTGDVTLSGLALNVDVEGQLDPHLQYTLLTCTGTRAGTFASRNVPPGWMVSYEANGDVKLMYMGGTMIRLR